MHLSDVILKKQVLAVSRVMVAWQPIGISMGVYDMCLRYCDDILNFMYEIVAS